MSLFVINRYEGEEQEETKSEKNHLSDLLKRIEERKRQRAAQDEKTVLVEDSEATDLSALKKRKKNKDNHSESSITEKDIAHKDDKQDTAVHETIPKNENLRKRKKKRKKNIQDEEDTCIESQMSKNEGLTLETTDVNDKKDETNNESLTPDDDQKRKVEDETNFVVLGSKTQKKKREVRRVLPDWLAHPGIVSVDLASGPSLDELESILDPRLIEILKANNVNKLFPVQASMVSWLTKCSKDRKQGWWQRDTCVSAPTGSGKTLAYVLPIVQELQTRLVPKVRCLVVVPVQELAAQIFKVMVTYTSHTNLKVGQLSGASSLEQEQNNILKKTGRGEYVSTVDIVVATPGRLIDHLLKTPGFSLDDLRFLVIDEADRTADWLQYLPEPHYRASQLSLANLQSSKLPAQKLLFSATLSQDPEKLSRLGLFQPILFTSVVVSNKDGDVNLDKEIGNFAGRYTSPEELTELAVECTAEYKPVALYQLLTRSEATSKTLVFTNSGETAHRLALLLRLFLAEKKVSVGELSAQLAPKQRESVLQNFAAGDIHVLISSDALARGVDVPDVQLVVSYDLPKHIKGYIHRAGRTGRAGKHGTAMSVLTKNQVGIFKHMLSNAHKNVPNIEKLELESAAEEINYQAQVEKLKEILEKEKHDALQRTKAVKRA